MAVQRSTLPPGLARPLPKLRRNPVAAQDATGGGPLPCSANSTRDKAQWRCRCAAPAPGPLHSQPPCEPRSMPASAVPARAAARWGRAPCRIKHSSTSSRRLVERRHDTGVEFIRQRWAMRAKVASLMSVGSLSAKAGRDGRMPAIFVAEAQGASQVFAGLAATARGLAIGIPMTARNGPVPQLLAPIPAENSQAAKTRGSPLEHLGNTHLRAVMQAVRCDCTAGGRHDPRESVHTGPAAPGVGIGPHARWRRSAGPQGWSAAGPKYARPESPRCDFRRPRRARSWAKSSGS